MAQKSDGWGSRVGLILAMAGNAVGLGNFLRFPVQAVENGGGTFIIPYLVCFLLMGIPMLWVEWSMGRFGGRDGNHSTPFILDTMTKKKFWKYFGVFGIFTNIAVAAYYCYIESWTLSYVFHSVGQTFTGQSDAWIAQFFNHYVDIGSGTFFSGFAGEPIIIYVICLALNTFILSRGLSGGVEKVAKIGMPVLLLFGAILAIVGVTMGKTGACADCDSHLALDFLWKPQFGDIWNFKVWLAAAGQIFFTLSVGMGTIHCYAAYVRSKDDIALNAMSAGFMNGFVEIVLGASVVIPIAVGYFGLEWIQQPGNAGFMMAFKTMPFLFGKWGAALGTMGGVLWFGLLFFAGITSSLAMGTPWMGFMRDEFGWNDKKAAWSFGILVLIMGLPTVIFFSQGVFDEYDYWAGTVSLVVFALAELILFGWIFGVDKGWAELKAGADIKVPEVFKYITKYVTPVLLGVVFIGSLITPVNGDWGAAFKYSWELDPGSILGKLTHKGVSVNRAMWSDEYQSDLTGSVASISEVAVYDIDSVKTGSQFVVALEGEKEVFRELMGTDEETGKEDWRQMDVNDGNRSKFPADKIVKIPVSSSFTFDNREAITVAEGQAVKKGDAIAQGFHFNNTFYMNLSRLTLCLLFGFIAVLVFRANQRRTQKGDSRA